MTLSQAVLSFISIRDRRLMLRVSRWRPPRLVRWWMIAATRAGDGWLWYALGVAILFSGERERWRAVGAASLAALCGILVFRLLKRLTGRERPCAIEKHCWANLLPPDRFSFPSGHSITAFAIAVAVSHYYPDLRAGLLLCAASVAASRVMLGMHFLSDVLAGSMMGSLLACASLWLVR